MILSASRRTDLPCYYSNWLLNRLRAGYALVRNPFNHAQFSRVPLSPEVVDCIVFWTKDPQNMLDKLPLLDQMGYRYYFQFTLTPYDRSLEKGLRDKSEVESTFIALSQQLGRERVVWRYDPIILNEVLDIPYHRRQFKRLASKLAGFTDTVVISFVDTYQKLKSTGIRPLSVSEIGELAGIIGRLAASYGLRAVACCENMNLTSYGIQQSSCIDRARIEKICGAKLLLPADQNQRQGCGCVQSVDIGAYNTCLNGCVYCYANRGTALAEKNYRCHDPNGPLLFGTVSETDKITLREAKSNLILQTALF